MNIALVEICVPSHYMVTHALIKTYCILPGAKITVYTTQEIYQNLKENEKINNVKFVVKANDESVLSFLEKIKNSDPHRIHYCTISKYYEEFIQTFPDKDVLIFFHFHNIDYWFESIVKSQIKLLISTIKNNHKISNIYNQLVWCVKEIYRDPLRKKVIKKVIKLNSYYIALGEIQKNILSKHINKDKIIIFPSLIYENTHLPEITVQEKLRICIPGSVSAGKRDYFGFFELIDANFEFFKQHITIDLLGFFQEGEVKLLSQVQLFEKKGLEILYYKNFISPEVYDENLYKSDIILSNIAVILSEDGKGQIKETAAVYNMIRGAKPGLFPSEFILDSEFKDSVIFYDNYPDLLTKLNELILEPKKMITFKQNAIILSKQYSAPNLLPRLIQLNN